jgi:cation:H+ antiporter
MDLFTIALFILGGFVGLIVGGELLVRGASNLAAAMKVPPLVIGLTVVALGTSAPELAVTVQSCYENEADLAVGNIVGSNIANLLLILGLAAVVAPLTVSSQLFKLDIPVMIAAAIALFALGSDGSVSRGEGIALVVAMVMYLGWTMREARRESRKLEKELEELTPEDVPATPKTFIVNTIVGIAGLALLVYGADYTVNGCVELAKRFGVSELVIGLTIVAVGTSLPEMVVSVVAAMRGKRDLAVGNVIGSNILNVFAVLGIGAVVAPAGIAVSADSLAFDIPLMVAVSIVCYPVFLSGSSVTRLEGALMLLYYAAYAGWLAYSAAVLEQPPGRGALLGFLAPLAVVIGLLAVTRWRRQSWGKLPS